MQSLCDFTALPVSEVGPRDAKIKSQVVGDPVLEPVRGFEAIGLITGDLARQGMGVFSTNLTSVPGRASEANELRSFVLILSLAVPIAAAK